MTILLPNDGKNRIDDYDFNECMKYAPFKIDDVKEIIACSPEIGRASCREKV